MATVVSALTLVLSLLAAPSQNRPTGDELNGSWIAESIERAGKTYPVTPPASIRFEFEGDQVTISGLLGPDSKHTSAFTVTRTTTPRRIVIKDVNGAQLLGAYELSTDNTLALAIIDSRKGSQPISVRTDEKSLVLVFLLKKKSP